MLTEATVKVLDRSERRERVRLAWRAGRFECCECGSATETWRAFVHRVWKLWRQREVLVYPEDPLARGLTEALFAQLRPATVVRQLFDRPTPEQLATAVPASLEFLRVMGQLEENDRIVADDVEPS